MLQEVTNSLKVSQGLGHLRAVDIDITVVHPVMREFATVMCLRLRDLIFVMRELQILTAGVNIDGRSQIFFGHGRAFDMPAGSAHAPRGLPCDLAWLLACLPKREIQRIFLFHVVRASGSFAGALNQLIDVLAGKLAIAVELTCPVVDIALRFIGIALIDQILHKPDDIIHGFRNLRVHGRLLDIERGSVLIVFLDIFFGNLRCGNAFFLGTFDDLIIDIGEILHEFYLVAAVFQIFSERVEYNERSCVADMKIVVDRRSADIHLDLARLQRYEFFFFSCQCVINLHFRFLLSGSFRESHPSRFLPN